MYTSIGSKQKLHTGEVGENTAQKKGKSLPAVNPSTPDKAGTTPLKKITDTGNTMQFRLFSNSELRSMVRYTARKTEANTQALTLALY